MSLQRKRTLEMEKPLYQPANLMAPHHDESHTYTHTHTTTHTHTHTHSPKTNNTHSTRVCTLTMHTSDTSKIFNKGHIRVLFWLKKVMTFLQHFQFVVGHVGQ